MIVESENFIYNTILRKYVLTLTGFQNFTGLNYVTENNLASKDEAEADLIKNTNDVYLYFNNLRPNAGCKFTKRKNVLEYLIFQNYNDEVEILIEALVEQAKYTTQSGGNLMVNEYEYNGQLLNDNEKAQLLVSPTVKDILRQCILGDGSNIVFRIPQEEFRDGY